MRLPLCQCKTDCCAILLFTAAISASFCARIGEVQTAALLSNSCLSNFTLNHPAWEGPVKGHLVQPPTVNRGIFN